MDFWNSQLTEKSWLILQDLKKNYDFVLIGGWAAYLWTKQQKSKDIDIVVGINELQKLKNNPLAPLSKNEHLKKYELKIGEVDVDIYLSHYSKLAIPTEEIKNYISKIEGFDIISKEALLILKQGAEIDRGNSVKGEKDRIDMISLLFFSDIDFKKYKEILKKYNLGSYIERLIALVKNVRFEDKVLLELGLTPKNFKLKKEKILSELKKK